MEPDPEKSLRIQLVISPDLSPLLFYRGDCFILSAEWLVLFLYTHDKKKINLFDSEV